MFAGLLRSIQRSGSVDGSSDPYDWDARVEAWEDVAGTDGFAALRDAVCEAAAVALPERVLDLGAGSGLIALWLAPQARHVTALDVSRAMLERLDEHARDQRVANVTAVAGDMRSLPFEDESFEVVVSNYAFHHLHDDAKELALAEARRVLVPGGRLVVCDMMFSLSLEPRDRRLVMDKLVAIARRGPAGLLRIAKNAGRAAVGSWEHPAPPDVWERMLRDRHFEEPRRAAAERGGPRHRPAPGQDGGVKRPLLLARFARAIRGYSRDVRRSRRELSESTQEQALQPNTTADRDRGSRRR